MIFASVAAKAQALITENASTLLTGVGVVGTVTTAVLTGRATYKATETINEYNTICTPEDPDVPGEPLTKTDKVKMVWTEYIPPVGVGALTITSIIYANRISTAKVAAMAAAYGLSEKTLKEYKEKVEEKFGVKKATDIRDEIAQDRVTARPPDTREIIIAGSGNVLCFDTLSGRYFESSVEALRKAENSVNFEVANTNMASLSLFYESVGLPNTAFSDMVGWDLDNKCDLQISTTMSEDEKPCLVVDFVGYPKQDYGKMFT